MHQLQSRKIEPETTLVELEKSEVAIEGMTPTNKKAIKGIIFDLDGTLVDSYLPIMESLNYVRHRYELPPYTLDEVKKMVGRGLELLIGDAIGKDNVNDGVRMFRERYGKIFLEETKLMPGAKDLIAALDMKGYLMAVVSNKPAYFTSRILRAQSIIQYFKIVLGPDKVSQPKPDPEMIYRAIEDMSLTQDEIIYVGDMTLDIETSRRAGIRIFAVEGGSSSREELERASPDMLFRNLQELNRSL